MSNVKIYFSNSDKDEINYYVNLNDYKRLENALISIEKIYNDFSSDLIDMTKVRKIIKYALKKEGE